MSDSDLTSFKTPKKGEVFIPGSETPERSDLKYRNRTRTGKAYEHDNISFGKYYKAYDHNRKAILLPVEAIDNPEKLKRKRDTNNNDAGVDVEDQDKSSSNVSATKIVKTEQSKGGGTRIKSCKEYKHIGIGFYKVLDNEGNVYIVPHEQLHREAKCPIPGDKSSKRKKTQNRKKSRKRSSRKQKTSRKRTVKRKMTGGRSHYKLPSVPRGTKFEKGPGRYKYTAILPDGKRVNFGHRDYQHFRDRVPKNKGGKLWSHLDHNDRDRMKNYRARHRGVTTKNKTPAYKKKYSPSWFSYHYLW